MGAVADILAWVRSSRQKPQYMQNTQNGPLRGGSDGSLYVQSLVPTKHVLCDEGSYFITTNPTPSTGIAYGTTVQATFVDTVPFMQLINTGNPQDPQCPSVFLDYLKLIQIGGTAPASTTSVGLVIRLDTGFRTATAGTPATQVPVCANMNNASNAPVGRLITFSGAVATIPALSASGRQIARCMLKGGPTLLLDEYTIAAGINDTPGAQGYLTTVAAYSTRVPPFGIGPGQCATIHLWMIGGITSPYTYEFEMGHWER